MGSPATSPTPIPGISASKDAVGADGEVVGSTTKSSPAAARKSAKSDMNATRGEVRGRESENRRLEPNASADRWRLFLLTQVCYTSKSTGAQSQIQDDQCDSSKAERSTTPSTICKTNSLQNGYQQGTQARNMTVFRASSHSSHKKNRLVPWIEGDEATLFSKPLHHGAGPKSGRRAPEDDFECPRANSAILERPQAKASRDAEKLIEAPRPT